MRFRTLAAAAVLVSLARSPAPARLAAGPVVLGPVREVAIVERFGTAPAGAWVQTCGQNVAATLAVRARVAGLPGPLLEAGAARKDPRDAEPGHNWMSLARKDLPAGRVPAGLDGFRFVLGSRDETQWWIGVTLTTGSGETYSTVLADHGFPAARLVRYSVPLERFQTASRQPLTEEKARDLRGVAFATSSPGTALTFDRIAAYRRDRLPFWLDFATTHPDNNLFERGARVGIVFRPGGAPPAAATGFRYEIRDYDGRVTARGGARLTGAAAYRFDATPRTHGCYEVSATLVDAAGKDVWPTSCIRAEGSVPVGLGTFSVLPVTLAENAARFRRLGENAFFGLHGDFVRLADYVGLTWRFGYTGWQYLEPERPDRSSGMAPWAREAIRRGPEPGGTTHILPFTLNLGEGTPAWARSPDPKAPGFVWDDALAMVRDSVRVEKARYPHMRHRLYGGLWEVDLNAPAYHVHTPEYTPADIAEVYRRIREVVRAEDPDGRVIGPCASIIRPAWFEAAFRAGVLQWVDGIETHAYPDGRFTPEADDLPGKIRALDALVRRYHNGRPLPLYITELGSPGVLGDDPISRSQAQRMVRASIILKGEGVRVFLPFYGIDYDAGCFGFLYNLDLESPSGPWSTRRCSPKPMVNAMAACAQLLEGAAPRGRLHGLGRDVWAYAFRRGGTRITAAWSPAGLRQAAVPVGRARSVEVVDMMGHSRRAAAAVRGVVRVPVGESPLYVLAPAGR